MSERADEILATLRDQGWELAIHQASPGRASYLFLHPTGIWAQGESYCAELALQAAQAQAAERAAWVWAGFQVRSACELPRDGYMPAAPAGLVRWWAKAQAHARQEVQA